MATSPFSPPSAPFFTSEKSPFDPPSAPASETYVAPLPKLDASEVESTSAAIEVVVRWGQDILHIEHIESPKAFAVGEAADFALPSAKLGMDRAEIVSVQNGRPFAVIMPNATARITVAGRTITLEDAIAEGIAVPSSAAAGAHQVALVDGARVKIELSGFEFELASVNAGKKVAGKGHGDTKAFGGQAVSLAIHGLIAAALFAFMPALASTDEDKMSDEQAYQFQAILKAAEADLAREMDETLTSGESAPKDSAMAASNAPKNNDKGVMGKATAAATNKRTAISTDQKERALSRSEALRDAQSFGMIDLIGTLNQGSANDTASAPWGKVASGPDAKNAIGAMWADEIGDSFGHGLDISGTGERGGGPFGGQYLGSLSTISNGDGTCEGPNCGPGGNGPGGNGTFTGYLPGTHKSSIKPPRPGVLTLSGRIPPEVIQRVVRQHFGGVRGCYEMGLRTNPNLAGRVVISFTIGRDGAVGMVNASGDMPADVTSCVAKTFYGLSFPAPDGGVVNVTYPISLSPN